MDKLDSGKYLLPKTSCDDDLQIAWLSYVAESEIGFV